MLTNVILVVLGLLAAVVGFTGVFSRSKRLRSRMRSSTLKMPKERRSSAPKEGEQEEIVVRSEPTFDEVFKRRYGSVHSSEEENLDLSSIEPEKIEIELADIQPKANAGALPEAKTPTALPHGEKVQFTCVYPGAVSAHQWYNLLLYVHLAERAQDVRNLLEKQSAEIGSEPMTSGAIAARIIERGTRLKLVPELKGFRFNPPSMELDWLEDVQQVRFRIMAGDDLAGSSSLGAIDIYAAGLLIAQVPLSVRVRQPGEAETVESQIILARMFEKVFASYSHKDKAVVDACCALSKSMGISMFVDSASLLSGDDWEKKLREAIRSSDVFQLFWSPNSSVSKEVEKEWRAALGLVGEKTERFIRPLYWLQPLPTVPKELNTFHFAQLPLESMIELLSRTATSGG